MPKGFKGSACVDHGHGEQMPSGRCYPCSVLRTRKVLRRLNGVDLSTVRPADVDERCQICGIREDASSQLHLDHSHTTGAFRGWLCGNCNRAIGCMQDDPERLRAAAEYLGG